jgi:hypothetical protein
MFIGDRLHRLWSTHTSYVAVKECVGYRRDCVVVRTGNNWLVQSSNEVDTLFSQRPHAAVGRKVTRASNDSPVIALNLLYR